MNDGNESGSRGGSAQSAGFWFAAADLLLELDDHGHIRHASGAGLTLTGREPESLIGGHLAEIVAHQDRARLADLLDEVRRRNIVGPEAMALERTGFVASLGLCCWPHDLARIFVAITPSRTPLHRRSHEPRDPISKTLAQEDFAAVAAELVERAETAGPILKLSFVDIEPSIRGEADADGSAWLSGIAGVLRYASYGGDATTRLRPYGFAVLIDARTDVAGLVGGALEELRGHPARDGSADIYCRDVAFDVLGLNHQDTAALIAFTTSRFAASAPAAGFDIDSLSLAMKELLRGTSGKLSALKQSVLNKDFRIVFQPIVLLESGAIHHYEVLSRFSHGDTPYQTVLFAERNGLIEDLDLAVIQKAVQAIQDTAAQGSAARLAVNISARSLGSSILMKTLDELLADLGPLRHHLLLEISETNLIEDLAAAGKLLERFRNAGNPICLDDFGSGVSSFPYLQSLPIDFVKVDGSYVRTMLTDSRHAAIIKAMAALCHDLDIRTVAEMIETEDQALKLREFGIDFGQGWLFGRPVVALPGGEGADTAKAHKAFTGR